MEGVYKVRFNLNLHSYSYMLFESLNIFLCQYIYNVLFHYVYNICGNVNKCFSSMLQMAELSHWCLSEEPVDRPEMKEIVVAVSKIVMSSIEWEASLGGDSQVFSGVFDGR